MYYMNLEFIPKGVADQKSCRKDEAHIHKAQ